MAELLLRGRRRGAGAAGADAGVRERTEADSADHITARMQSYSFDGDGMFTVTLDNGQVWRQIAGDTDYAHWKKPAGGYVVRISHGLLGSYNLQVVKTPGIYKVRRVS